MQHAIETQTVARYDRHHVLDMSEVSECSCATQIRLVSHE